MLRAIFCTLSFGVAAVSVGQEQPSAEETTSKLLAPTWVEQLEGLLGFGVGDFDISPDRRTLAVPTAKGEVQYRDVISGKLQKEFKAHSRMTRRARYSPDGKRLVTVDSAARPRRPELRLWDTETKKRIWTRKLTASNIESLWFTEDGGEIRFLAYRKIYRYSAADGKPLGMTPLSAESFRGVRIAFSGRYVLLSEPRGAVYDIRTEKVTCTLALDGVVGANESCPYWFVSQDAKRSALVVEAPIGAANHPPAWANYRPQRLYIFDHAQQQLMAEFPVKPLSIVTTADFSADGRYLVTAGRRPLIEPHFATSKEDISIKPVSDGASGRVLPNGRTALTDYRRYHRWLKNSIQVYDLQAKAIIARYPLREFDIQAIRFADYGPRRFIFTGTTSESWLEGAPPTTFPSIAAFFQASRRTKGRRHVGAIIGCLEFEEATDGQSP